MKNIQIIIVIIALYITACKNNNTSEIKSDQDTTKTVENPMLKDSLNPGVKRFEVEKGKLEMIMFSSDKNLYKKIIYFDRYGARLTSIINFGNRIQYEYQQNGFSYHFNTADSHLVKEIFKPETFYDPQMLNTLLINDTIKKEINWTSTGFTEVLGRKCEKFECHDTRLNFHSEVYLYKGLPLFNKTTEPNGQVNITECKAFDENISVDNKNFIIPKSKK